MKSIDRYLKFRAEIGEILDPTLYSMEWLDRQVLEGRAQVWATEDAVLLTEINSYPTGATEIHAMCAVGDMRQIVEQLAPAAEKWGKEMGCIAASVASREGWVRALGPHGYSFHQVCLRKEL